MTPSTDTSLTSPGASAAQSTFSERLELLFAVAGLAFVSVLYREKLIALDPAKWATVSAWVLFLVGIAITQQ